MAKVWGVRCKLCGDEIWSRHRHDFRWCRCGAVAVDGGRGYTKICGTELDVIELEVELGEQVTKTT